MRGAPDARTHHSERGDSYRSAELKGADEFLRLSRSGQRFELFEA
jgi:hypothetical protein